MVEYVIYDTPGRSKEYVKWIIIGSLLLISLVLPFTTHILRYQLGAVFRFIFGTVGMGCLIIGGFLTAIGFFSIFTKRLMIGTLIVGALLLWVGSWLTGITIDFFGFNLGAESPTNDPGFHYL